ncbi:MAG: mercuric reductase [Burkholderiales bacterium]|jgi:pyruvate/2-oxoglutarate dehydrogenase complex dihydrolipoamide dehydrogenase (E3) component|nr:mercuric reductase [Burkholderiales bacterium]
MSTLTAPGSASGDGAHERELLANVCPSGWANPVPSGVYHLIIIGAGPGGLAAARAVAGLGMNVALIERHRLGGSSLSYGCVPSKAMIRSSRLYAEMRDAPNFGAVSPPTIEVDFPGVMQRMRRIRARISRIDSAARLLADGIDLYFGSAHFVGADAVEVDSVRLRFKKALIATGSRSILPEIPGLAEAGYLTNETVFDLTTLPRSLLVIGGGPLGCELAQAFSRFGVQTIIAHDTPLFLPKEERDAAQMVSEALARDGVEIHLNTEAISVRVERGHKLVELVNDGNVVTAEVDEILTGIGHMPAVRALKLEAAGVTYDPEAGIRVDDFLRTSNPRIYAAGDVCLEHKYSNMAEASARLAVENALFFGRRRMSALTIPWCTYTDPEIAHVGMYVRQARERNIPIKTFTVPMHDVDRAITDGEENGFVKIHVREGTDTVLGATIVARHAGEMINSISVAMEAGIGLRTLARVVHAYPTQAEAIKMAADACWRTQPSHPMGRLLRAWLNR